jgi:predicted nucleotidyltransferase
MIEKLFSSKARVEIMKLFLFNPHDSYYQSQISSLTHQPIRAVQRELERLVSIGLIAKAMQGNRVYYKTNTKCSIFNELKSIFFKTVGIAEVLKARLEAKEDIKIAFIYGSYAKGQENLMSDIDLMVVGNVSSRRLSSILAEVKRELGREINYAVFTEDEYRQKVRKKNHFISSVLDDKKIFIIGNKDELKRTSRSR